MLVANKTAVIGGIPYNAGDPVDANLLAEGKAQQLIARRILRDEGVTRPSTCVVLRDVHVKGKLYAKGTKVSVARLPAGKVAQMLDHRILGPAMVP